MARETPAQHLPVPGPLSDEDAGLEARVRQKDWWRLRLSDREREILARLPSDKGIPAEVVRELAERHGGIGPRKAAEHPEDAGHSLQGSG